MLYDKIGSMIKAEALSLGVAFIDVKNLDEYVKKIEGKAEFLVHLHEGKCVGFVAFYANNFVTREAFITMVLVDEKMRGKKIASSLVKAVLQRVKDIGFEKCSLEVKKLNANAIKLYESLGFIIIETKIDSFLMGKKL